MPDDHSDSLAKRSAERVHDAAVDIADDVKSRAKSKLGDAVGAVDDVYGDARDNALDFFDSVLVRARKRPLLTLGLGLAAGLVLGSAFRAHRDAA